MSISYSSCNDNCIYTWIKNSDQRQKMVSICRKRAIAHFDWGIAGDRYLQLMHKYKDGNVLD